MKLTSLRLFLSIVKLAKMTSHFPTVIFCLLSSASVYFSQGYFSLAANVMHFNWVHRESFAVSFLAWGSIIEAFVFLLSFCLCGRSPPPQEANVFPAVRRPRETNGWRIWGEPCSRTRYVNARDVQGDRGAVGQSVQMSSGVPNPRPRSATQIKTH